MTESELSPWEMERLSLDTQRIALDRVQLSYDEKKLTVDNEHRQHAMALDFATVHATKSASRMRALLCGLIIISVFTLFSRVIDVGQEHQQLRFETERYTVGKGVEAEIYAHDANYSIHNNWADFLGQLANFVYRLVRQPDLERLERLKR